MRPTTTRVVKISKYPRALITHPAETYPLILQLPIQTPQLPIRQPRPPPIKRNLKNIQIRLKHLRSVTPRREIRHRIPLPRRRIPHLDRLSHLRLPDRRISDITRVQPAGGIVVVAEQDGGAVECEVRAGDLLAPALEGGHAVVAEFVAEATDGEGGGVVEDGGVVVVEVCFAVDGADGY